MHKQYRLIGESLKHSLSPQIHKLIFKYTTIKGEYSLCEVAPSSLDDYILSLHNENISGVNVTIPYKNLVMDYMDSLSDIAQKTSAINTILVKGNKFEGHNTDYYGFGKMLRKAEISVEHKKIIVLGSGGSARSVIAYLQDNNCNDITVISRNKQKAEEKIKNVIVKSYDEFEKYDKFNILINTTPVGMYPNINDCPLNEDIIVGFDEVVDLIYNPYNTKLLSIANKNGIKHINGLYMLVAQAVKSQEIWNKCIIDDKVIDKIYNNIKDDICQ